MTRDAQQDEIEKPEPTTAPDRDDQTLGYIDRMVAQIGAANRPFVADFVQRQHASGLKPGSVAHYAASARHADAWAQGQRFDLIEAKRWTEFVIKTRADFADSNAYTMTLCMRRMMKELHQVPQLGDVSWELDNCLYMREPEARVAGQLVAREWFHQIVKVATSKFAFYKTVPAILLIQALLWTLWDSGFRISELLSLRVGDVEFVKEGVKLSLNPRAKRLKTGPRNIFALECAAILRAWLAVHPAAHDKQAPLFIGIRDRTGYRRMTYTVWYRVLVELGTVSGWEGVQSTGEPLNSHDFRHSCATRKARLNWQPYRLNAYFGWKAGSKMAETYIHLAFGDQMDQVRRDAGLDEYGYKEAVEAGDEDEAYWALLEKRLAARHVRRSGALTGSPASTGVPKDLVPSP